MINELVNDILKYRDAYWNGESLISDSDYDKLINKLRQLDPNHAILNTIEHSKFKDSKLKVNHANPMLSLDKVYNKEALKKWMLSVSRNEEEVFLIQPKYDGISCHYDKGQYSTRGDGYVGENITDVCMALCYHETENNKKKYDFYGEIVIKKSDFANLYQGIYKPDGNKFKNSRNAVAGIIGIDDYLHYANQNAVITLVDYDKYSFDIKISDFDNKWEVIKCIINTLDYPMDGIVVKIADNEYAKSLGSTAHHPKSAIAFKFENASAITKLVDIEFGMGKENITATAIFEPIDLNGVTINKAVIPMNSKTLPCIYKGDFTKGSEIVVERAGDVIPHIVSVKTNSFGRIFKIDKCPFCGSDIEITDSAIKCANDNCRKKMVHKLYDALTVLGIKNVGEKNVDVISYYIFEKNGLKINLDSWMSQITKSNICLEQLSKIPRFGLKSAQNTIDETQKIRTTTVGKFIAALGIPNVGIKIGNELEKFGEILNILKLSEEDLANVDGVGEVMAKRLYDIFQSNFDYILSISSHFFFNNSNQTACNKTICFTGEMMYPRSYMQRLASSAGYQSISSVTKNLGVLVVADKTDLTSSKCVKALKYGIKIIDESEFYKLIQK